MNRDRIAKVVATIKDADRVDASMSEPVSTTAVTATADALPLLEEMLAEMDRAAATPVRDALLLHLRECGYVSYDDGTVAFFQGSFAVGEDSVTPIVWTSAERLADAVLARFELEDRQAARVDGLDVRERPDGRFVVSCRRCDWEDVDTSVPSAAGNWAVNHACPRSR
jgi:hypothetical protein